MDIRVMESKSEFVVAVGVAHLGEAIRPANKVKRKVRKSDK